MNSLQTADETTWDAVKQTTKENANLRLKNTTLQQAIDAQQAKLNNYRENPSAMQKKFDAALQALAAERVQNAILQGQIEALKGKRKPSAPALLNVRHAAELVESSNTDLAEFYSWIGTSTPMTGERILQAGISKLRDAATCYAAALKELI